MIFINETETIGQIMSAGTTGLAGNLVTAIYLILIFLIVIALMFGIPLEFLSVIIFPFCIAIASYYGNFMTPVVVIIIYVSTIIAKNWIFR